MKTILIIGATSAIAESFARLYAKDGASLILMGRNPGKMDIISSDLVVRGAQNVDSFLLDFTEIDLLKLTLVKIWTSYSSIDVVLIAHGSLPDQPLVEEDVFYALTHFRNNAETTIVCAGLVANHLEKQRDGTLALIGSVAGDRGRKSNYLYAASKSAVETFSSGLRARLYKKGVNVLLIKPGFVATPMTADMNIPTKLLASPETVAEDIKTAIERGRSVLYTPWVWKWVMLLIKLLPEAIFKRISF